MLFVAFSCDTILQKLSPRIICLSIGERDKSCFIILLSAMSGCGNEYLTAFGLLSEPFLFLIMNARIWFWRLSHSSCAQLLMKESLSIGTARSTWCNNPTWGCWFKYSDHCPHSSWVACSIIAQHFCTTFTLDMFLGLKVQLTTFLMACLCWKPCISEMRNR